MAARLAWLKSRLLLPHDPEAAEEGELASDALAARLAELQVMREAAAWLDARPRLGCDVFARGAPEDRTEIDRSRLALTMPALIRAYLSAVRRSAGERRYRPAQPAWIFTVQDALRRLERLLGSLPDWTTLERFLPETPADPARRRAALASTLVASLELARGGRLRLRQERPFGPILLRQATEAAP
jgi:segregation and condensation protein A